MSAAAAAAASAEPPFETVPLDEDIDLFTQAEAVLSGDPSALEALMRGVEEADARDAPPPVRAELVQLPVVIDDFIRNYFSQNGFMKSLEAFELEWYSRHGSVPQEQAMCVPDVYVAQSRLQDKNNLLAQEMQRQKDTALRAVVLWEKAKKERDLHKVNHTRVVQEKGRMVRDMKRLQDHTQSIEPTVVELKAKYENAQKERMLLRLDRDKLASRVSQLEEQVRSLEQQQGAAALSSGSPRDLAGSSGAAPPISAAAKAAAFGRRPIHSIAHKDHQQQQQQLRGSSVGNRAAGTSKSSTITTANQQHQHQQHQAPSLLGATIAASWPADVRPNPDFAPGAQPPAAPSNYTSWSFRYTIKGHEMAVPCVALHPKKAAAVSCSDDGTWRLFPLPRGEPAICSGEGHTSWVSSCAIHPRGTMCATGSGDMSVKIWDFASNTCKMTLKAHADGVMCVDFQETGELLLSGSLDYSCRVWDVETGKVRQGLRGHKEAVNSAKWVPYTNLCVTGSADKMVSLWDCRMANCVQTFLNHRSAVNKVATAQSSRDPTMPEIASCDALGYVTTWDIRTMQSKHVFEMDDTANSIAFDQSAKILAVALDNHNISLCDLEEGKKNKAILKGHDDAVLDVAFDPVNNAFLVSSGADGTVRYWN